jgi:hypothetical protein
MIAKNIITDEKDRGMVRLSSRLKKLGRASKMVVTKTAKVPNR